MLCLSKGAVLDFHLMGYGDRGGASMDGPVSGRLAGGRRTGALHGRQALAVRPVQVIRR
jgi:hypothetical protein